MSMTAIDHLLNRLLATALPVCQEAATVIKQLQQANEELGKLLMAEPEPPKTNPVPRKRRKLGGFKRGTPTKDRFFGRVDVRGPDECWLWLGCGNDRYGQIVDDRGRRMPVHRYSFELHMRPLKKHEHVLHLCDNSWCVNPMHLEVGTHRQNMLDRSRRGRHSNAVATPEQAKEIHERYQAGEQARSLAEAFGLKISTIYNIGLGYHWKSLGLTAKQSKLTKTQKRERIARRQSVLAADDVRAIRRRAREGTTHKELAAVFGIHPSSVSHIISGKRWGHVK